MTIWYNQADNTLHDDMDGAAISLPSWPQGMVVATYEQINKLTQPSNDMLIFNYKDDANKALSASDTTVIRCFENGIQLPPEWVEYRKALRAIISSDVNDINTPFPTKPKYPEGT